MAKIKNCEKLSFVKNCLVSIGHRGILVVATLIEYRSQFHPYKFRPVKTLPPYLIFGGIF